jgi:hypothetical protein
MESDGGRVQATESTIRATKLGYRKYHGSAAGILGNDLHSECDGNELLRVGRPFDFRERPERTTLSIISAQSLACSFRQFNL